MAVTGSGGAAGRSELAPSGAAAAERAGSGAIAAIAAPATGAVAAEEPRPGRTVGINRSLLTNTYYPLYRGFFEALGYRVVCPEGVHPEGVERVGAAFCYPVEVSHGTLFTLLAMKPDILFSPDVRSMNVDKSVNVKATCPFIHAESNYLLSAFPESARGPVIEPILDFAKGIESQQAVFVAIARRLGHAAAEGKAAFRAGASAQRALAKDFKSVGREFVEYLGENPHEVGIVVFGRAYNAFSSLGNKGIPHKFATRGYRIIPCDFLPFEDEENPEHMYWASGEINLKAAKFVKKHRNIFGVYITNFSCGPDSFVVDFFRKEMGSKPSLTLELDNHTADVGLDTRIEAFIDVVKSFRLLEASALNTAAREAALKAAAISGTVVSSASASAAAAAEAAAKPYRLAETLVEKGKFRVVDSRGRKYALTDPHVHLLIPSMMDRASQAIAAVFRGVGIRADAMPDPTDKEFRIGRAYTSGKECLPIIVNAGSLVSYLRERENKDELLVYFMPGDSGPCRFGSYYVLLRNLMEKLKVEDVAFLNLSQDDGYAGLSRATTLRLWRTFIVSDVLEQVYAAILVLAADRAAALKAFDEFYDELIAGLEKDSWGKILGKLREGAKTLSEIPRKKSLKDVPHVALINEMYVRRNNFSRQFIVEKLADRGILTLVATLHEWLFYIDLMVLKKRVQHTTALRRAATAVEYPIKKMSETTIKDIFAASGFYEPKYVDTAKVLESASGLVTETLVCESILITGTTIRELVDEVDGVISIQPFGCMPGRIAESILGDKLSEKKAERAENRPLVEAVLGDFHRLPFLVVDVDGQVFPPLIEAKLEAFLLQANRIHGARIANQGEAPGAGSTFGRAASGDPSRAASGTSD